MNKLVMALLVSFIGHIIAWFHMQGQFKYEWAKGLVVGCSWWCSNKFLFLLWNSLVL